ncbi:PREDICTED: uncharacterized protein LOC105448017 [Wasmannia auropunctata]|uniref:uncharacterized protein LOC105448017 n=1 Tax=Wasmannia auropunctata TaxID=64793 RepID=UPI0005EFFA65|nr:PREDICTED: uncharacterized protein LOC105448017 [Wasmannia auropunctata]
MTTKLRVVFDASSKTTNGIALNDKLMPGPNLQADLQRILIRFRTHEFVITADVAFMFRQVLINPRDRNLQLILWRNEVTQPRQLYQLDTITYGTACAPFLAMRCLKELAKIYQQEFPLVARAVEQDFYMDDVLTGGSTLEDVMTLQKQLTEMLARGKFPLRKWRANHPSILKHLSEHSTTSDLLVIDKDQPIKTLGLLWNATTNVLQYRITLDENKSNTKRSMLSKIAQRQAIEWDQELPINLRISWGKYYTLLTRLNDVRVKRNINIKNSSSTFDLYGFGYASEAAYGACLYAVSTDQHGIRQSELICARTKVAPLKTISLPRLELEAALMLARLFDTVKKSCRNKINKVKLWSDSTVTLG